MNSNVGRVLLAGSLAATIAIVALRLYRRKRWRRVGKVASLHIHPLKGGAVNKVHSAEVTKWGLRDETNCFDRHLLLISEKTSRFVTSRQASRLALVKVQRNGALITFSINGDDSIRSSVIDLDAIVAMNIQRRVGLWQYENRDPLHIDAIDCGDAIAIWMLEHVIREESYPDGVRVVYYDSDNVSLFNDRTVNRFWPITRRDRAVFHDLSSYMLATLPSLRDINGRLEASERVPMDQFRPNIVVDGDFTAYAEDKWRYVRIGEACFTNIKPCTRCVVTTINTETGERSASGEPLKELKRYRLVKDEPWASLSGNSPQFGVNLVVDKLTSQPVHVGDGVFVSD